MAIVTRPRRAPAGRLYAGVRAGGSSGQPGSPLRRLKLRRLRRRRAHPSASHVQRGRDAPSDSAVLRSDPPRRLGGARPSLAHPQLRVGASDRSALLEATPLKVVSVDSVERLGAVGLLRGSGPGVSGPAKSSSQNPATGPPRERAASPGPRREKRLPG